MPQVPSQKISDGAPEEYRRDDHQQKYYDGVPGHYYCVCLFCRCLFYGAKRDYCCPRCTKPTLKTQSPNMRIDDVTVRLVDAWPVSYRMPEKEPTHYRFEMHVRVNGYSRGIVSAAIQRSDLVSKLDIVIDTLKRELVKSIIASDKTFFDPKVTNESGAHTS